MDTAKRNYTTVNNWFKTMKSLCRFNVEPGYEKYAGFCYHKKGIYY